MVMINFPLLEHTVRRTARTDRSIDIEWMNADKEQLSGPKLRVHLRQFVIEYTNQSIVS